MTTASAVNRFTFTNDELIFLASLRGARAVVGVNDPLRGRSAREVQRTLVAAGTRLLEQGYVIKVSDDELDPAPELRELVDAIVRPERSLFAFVTEATAADAVSSGVRRVFHVRRSTVVALLGDVSGVEMRRLQDWQASAADVLEFWAVAGQAPACADNSEFELPRSVLHDVARIAAHSGAEPARERLQMAGVGPDAAPALALTLAEPRRNTALLPFSIDTTTAKRVGIGMLEGTNGLWELRIGEHNRTPTVRVRPCSGAVLAERVRDFVQSETT